MDKPDKSKAKPSDWELESAFDLAATLEDLINSPAFKEASDEKGESVTCGTRLPLWLHRRISKLKEMPESPYEVASDVLRDAVHIGLQVLHMRFGMSPDWEVERKMIAVVDATGVLRRIKAQVDMLTGGLEELREAGDLDQAAYRLSEYVTAASEVANKWHRGRLFRLLGASRAVKEIASACSPEVQKLIKEGGKQ